MLSSGGEEIAVEMIGFLIFSYCIVAFIVAMLAVTSYIDNRYHIHTKKGILRDIGIGVGWLPLAIIFGIYICVKSTYNAVAYYRRIPWK